jgi:hypothetical protein
MWRAPEGPVGDGVRDGAPDVDDAHAGGEEAFGVGAEVEVDAGDGGVEGLVYVHAFRWASNAG